MREETEGGARTSSVGLSWLLAVVARTDNDDGDDDDAEEEEEGSEKVKDWLLSLKWRRWVCAVYV